MSNLSDVDIIKNVLDNGGYIKKIWMPGTTIFKLYDKNELLINTITFEDYSELSCGGYIKNMKSLTETVDGNECACEIFYKR